MGVCETWDKFYPTGWYDLDASLPISISLTLSFSHFCHSPHYSHFVNLCEVKPLHLWREEDHPVERWS